MVPVSNANPRTSKIFISLLTRPLLRITFSGVPPIDGLDIVALDKSKSKSLCLILLWSLGGGWPKNVSCGPVDNVTLFPQLILG